MALNGISKKGSYEGSSFEVEPKADHISSRALLYDLIRIRSRKLNPTDRILINLIFEGHYKYADLAALLGISESSLTYRIKRLEKLLCRPSRTVSHHWQQPGPEELKIVRMALHDNQSLQTHTMRYHRNFL